MELKGSSPCSQQLATGPYPAADESSPHTPILVNSLGSILILSFHLHLNPPSGLLLSGSPT
jgi:hypothetical protein